jgi:hypothetical protein
VPHEREQRTKPLHGMGAGMHEHAAKAITTLPEWLYAAMKAEAGAHESMSVEQ